MPREPNQKWMARIYLPFQLELQVAEESTTLSFYLSHSHFDKPIGLMVFYWGFHQVHFDVGLYLLNLLFKGYQGGFTIRLKDYLIKTSIIQNSPKPRDCERIRPFSRENARPKSLGLVALHHNARKGRLIRNLVLVHIEVVQAQRRQLRFWLIKFLSRHMAIGSHTCPFAVQAPAPMDNMSSAFMLVNFSLGWLMWFFLHNGFLCSSPISKSTSSSKASAPAEAAGTSPEDSAPAEAAGTSPPSSIRLKQLDPRQQR